MNVETPPRHFLDLTSQALAGLGGLLDHRCVPPRILIHLANRDADLIQRGGLFADPGGHVRDDGVYFHHSRDDPFEFGTVFDDKTDACPDFGA